MKYVIIFLFGFNAYGFNFSMNPANVFSLNPANPSSPVNVSHREKVKKETKEKKKEEKQKEKTKKEEL